MTSSRGVWSVSAETAGIRRSRVSTACEARTAASVARPSRYPASLAFGTRPTIAPTATAATKSNAFISARVRRAARRNPITAVT
jgi:hypothetical protein